MFRLRMKLWNYNTDHIHLNYRRFLEKDIMKIKKSQKYDLGISEASRGNITKPMVWLAIHYA